MGFVVTNTQQRSHDSRLAANYIQICSVESRDDSTPWIKDISKRVCLGLTKQAATVSSNNLGRNEQQKQGR